MAEIEVKRAGNNGHLAIGYQRLEVENEKLQRVESNGETCNGLTRPTKLEL